MAVHCQRRDVSTMPIGVSVVIITRNAQATLRRTLDTLRRFDDIVVYDNGSTDDTCSLAREFANVTLHQGEFLGFGLTKRYAVSLAKYDWVLSLDADEAPSASLIDAIAHWVTEATPHQVGKILRENWMLERPVHHSGWGNDWLIRLFNRRIYNFNDAMVHESVKLDSAAQISALTGNIVHLAVMDLSQFLEKINRYSSIRATSGKLNAYPFPLIVLKALFAFIKTYLFKLGFLDGWRGWVIATANANGVFWKYAKQYAQTSSGCPSASDTRPPDMESPPRH